MGNAFRDAGNFIEELAQHDQAEERKNQQGDEVKGDVLVAQDVVFNGKVHEARNGRQKEKCEDDGEFIIKPLVFDREPAEQLPEIHDCCLTEYD